MMPKPVQSKRTADIHIRVTPARKLQYERWAEQMKYPSLSAFLDAAAEAHRKEGR